MHLLTVHLPQQIAALAIDPLYFSLQGLENCNKRRKQFKNLSNCHKVTKTIQIKSYVRKDGSKVPARSQSSGSTMCAQLLTHAILSDMHGNALQKPLKEN